jgi:hypothetical protein
MLEFGMLPLKMYDYMLLAQTKHNAYYFEGLLLSGDAWLVQRLMRKLRTLVH